MTLIAFYRQLKSKVTVQAEILGYPLGSGRWLWMISDARRVLAQGDARSEAEARTLAETALMAAHVAAIQRKTPVSLIHWLPDQPTKAEVAA